MATLDLKRTPDNSGTLHLEFGHVTFCHNFGVRGIFADRTVTVNTARRSNALSVFLPPAVSEEKVVEDAKRLLDILNAPIQPVKKSLHLTPEEGAVALHADLDDLPFRAQLCFNHTTDTLSVFLDRDVDLTGILSGETLVSSGRHTLLCEKIEQAKDALAQSLRMGELDFEALDELVVLDPSLVSTAFEIYLRGWNATYCHDFEEDIANRVLCGLAGFRIVGTYGNQAYAREKLSSVFPDNGLRHPVAQDKFETLISAESSAEVKWKYLYYLELCKHIDPSLIPDPPVIIPDSVLNGKPLPITVEDLLRDKPIQAAFDPQFGAISFESKNGPKTALKWHVDNPHFPRHLFLSVIPEDRQSSQLDRCHIELPLPLGTRLFRLVPEAQMS